MSFCMYMTLRALKLLSLLITNWVLMMHFYLVIFYGKDNLNLESLSYFNISLALFYLFNVY